MGEKEFEPFQFTFNGFLKVAFQGSRVTSDAGLILVRELDERLGLEAIMAEHLSDSRHGLNTSGRSCPLAYLWSHFRCKLPEVICMADYPKLLLAGALILVSAGTASAQQGRAAGDKDDMLAFVSERDGDSEIYVMNVDGIGLLRLTNNAGRDADPAWSPDGKRIAFASDRAGSSDIYVMNADGSNLVRRTETGSHRSGAPAWSPDGSKIAFSSLRGGQWGIYVMSVDGDWANPTRVGYDRGWNTHPAWSPDGKRIAFVSDWRAFDFVYEVYVMNADGSEITTLFDAGPFFSRDSPIFYFQPSWSPDGGKIAVVVCPRAWDDCHPSSSIGIANADGSGLKTLVQAGGFARPTFSPDGSTIAFSIQACRACAGSLWYVSTDGTKSGLIFSNGHSPAWRP